MDSRQSHGSQVSQGVAGRAHCRAPHASGKRLVHKDQGMPVVKFRVDPSFRRCPLRPAIIPAGTPAVLDSNEKV